MFEHDFYGNKARTVVFSIAEKSVDDCLVAFQAVAKSPGYGSVAPRFNDEGPSCFRSYANVGYFAFEC